MDIKERIIGATFQLVSQYGISSVTMDHIAKTCGISKRTLYEHFSDKNNLILEALLKKHHEQSLKFREIYNTSPNKLIALLRIYSIVNNTLSNLCPAFFMDMDRLYPLIAKEYKDIRMEHIKGFQKLLEEGQKEGIFRKDLHADIASLLYFFELHNVRHKLDEYNSTFKYTNVEIYATYFEFYVRGIATPYGIEIFEKFKQENENKF